MAKRKRPPFLLQRRTGRIYPYTELLAQRADVEPYWPKELPEEGGELEPETPLADLSFAELREMCVRRNTPVRSKKQALKFLSDIGVTGPDPDPDDDEDDDEDDD